jgi:SAM-dependent methyltransferase
MKELARGRKFRVYSALMDAAIEQKAKDVMPWIKAGTIVDAGFGTGLLLFRMWEKFRNSQFIGIDISSHFFKKARQQFRGIRNITLLKKNIIQQNLPNHSVDTKIFSTILHEVYSYNGYNIQFVKTALKNSLKELKPGGRIVIRDGIQPTLAQWCLSLNSQDGKSNPKLHPRYLNTEAMFLRFAKEFKHGRGVRYKILHDKKLGKLYCTDAASAYEFLSKKDYRDNWHLEINEQFGYLTLLQYKKLLREFGFKVIYAKSYRNPWIVKNRWHGKVKIYKKTNRGFKLIPYPDTNALIVAEKPKKTS